MPYYLVSTSDTTGSILSISGPSSKAKAERMRRHLQSAANACGAERSYRVHFSNGKTFDNRPLPINERINDAELPPL